MRRLLNTMFVTTEDVYLSLDGENVRASRDGEELALRPLHNLESIICFSRNGMSPALIGKCMRDGIAVSFLMPNGQYLGSVTGASIGNIHLRKQQYRISDAPEKSVLIARNMVAAKLYNCRWVIERAIRDHALRVAADRLSIASDKLNTASKTVAALDSLDSLRGMEGESAALYFSVFDELVLQQKVEFAFERRSRRPPLNRLNAMLSFCYSLLARDASAALASVGLDPYAGFMHRDRPGRASLALDLMEELRPVFADRFVISLINKRIINACDFIEEESGAFIMKDTARATFLTQWRDRKQKELMHPFLQERIMWGLVPYAQALLLARHIRGDLKEYPPFFWK